MPNLLPPFTAGRPRFADAALQRLADAGDAEAAWRAAWARAGDAAPAAVDGPFAVAFGDADTGRTVLAVDRFAIQTLCWRIVGGRLHVAARADDLAALAPAAAIDPQAIYDYLYFHVVPSPRTVFEGVFRVEPGHVVVVDDNGSVSTRPYWTPDFTATQGGGFDALAAEFRGLLQAAVAAQLDGGKPAAFLSGGTDSSTVAGMIGRAAGRPAATYSIGFQAEGYDEMAYARLAARHFGCEHHEYYVTPDDLVASIPALATHYDQPFGNSSALPAYHCARMAQQDGVTRLLAGDGGDELFGGNARYAKQRIFGAYDALPGGARRWLLRRFGDRPDGSAGNVLVRKAASYVEQARVPLPDRLQMYNLLLRSGIETVFEPAFLERVDTDAPAALQRAVWNSVGGSDLNRMLAFDWRFTLADADLPKVCGSAEMAGIGVAFPMLDARLVDFSLRLPDAYKLRGLKLRWFFKEALRGFLPDAILTKKKQGFGLPFGVWATQHAGLGRLAADSLRSLGERGIVRRDCIRQLLTRDLPAHPGYYGEMVWILMMLEQWLRGRPGSV